MNLNLSKLMLLLLALLLAPSAWPQGNKVNSAPIEESTGLKGACQDKFSVQLDTPGCNASLKRLELAHQFSLAYELLS